MSGREEIDALIARIALRDRAALGALYDKTSAKLFGICLRILNDRAEAEDALQEVYVKIWSNCGRYVAGCNSPMTWLITIARNCAIDMLRARAPEGAGVEQLETRPDPGPTPEASVMAGDEARRIARCLDRLEAGKSAAVRGAYLGGESYSALAARFDVPVNTMRTWLRRSLMKLRECLQE